MREMSTHYGGVFISLILRSPGRDKTIYFLTFIFMKYIAFLAIGLLTISATAFGATGSTSTGSTSTGSTSTGSTSTGSTSTGVVFTPTVIKGPGGIVQALNVTTGNIELVPQCFPWVWLLEYYKGNIFDMYKNQAICQAKRKVDFGM